MPDDIVKDEIQESEEEKDQRGVTDDAFAFKKLGD